MFRVVQVGGILLAIVLSGCSDNSATVASSVDDKSGLRQDSPIAPSRESQAVEGAVSRDQVWPRDYKANEYPGGAFTVTDYGSAPEGDAASVIKSLEPLAKSGSSKASFEIFLKTNECLGLIKSDTPKESKSAERLSWERTATERCKNLTPDDYAKASEWLELAAFQGSLPAQLTYASNVESIIGEASDYLRDPDAVKSYKERSHRYLTNAARRGSVDALLSLGNDYGYGIMAERSYTTSYAYFLATKKIDPNLVSEVKTSFLKSKLTPEQIRDATQMGESIYDECCRQK